MIGPLAILSYLFTHPMGTTHAPTAFVLESTRFSDHGRIPRLYTCWGKNKPPPLQWTGAPPQTKSYALLMIDEDVPRADWYQWIVFNIPASQTTVPQNTFSQINFVVANNSFNHARYHGPCFSGKKRRHHYQFIIYALDSKLSDALQADPIALRKAFEIHSLAKAELYGYVVRRKAKSRY